MTRMPSVRRGRTAVPAVQPRDVVVAGSLNMDLVVRAGRMPRPGETVLGGEFATHPGGKGANQAVAAARAGARTAMIGAIGDDAFGGRLRGTLVAEGIDVQGIEVIERTPTGVASIIVDERRGENAIVVSPGANAALTPALVRRHEPLLRGARILVFPLETPVDGLAVAARIARAAGGRVLLNAAPARPWEQLEPLHEHVDILVVNEGEAWDLLVGRDDPWAPPDDWRTDLAVIMTRGERPARLFPPAPRAGAARPPVVEIPASPVTPVVDTTGAGDAFVGVLAASLAADSDIDLADAAARAMVAGALATTREGAIPAMPSADAIAARLGRARPSPA